MARRLPFATTQREYLPSQLSNGMPPSSTLLVWRLAIFAVLIWPIIIFSLYSGHPKLTHGVPLALSSAKVPRVAFGWRAFDILH
jgi:hypothetical protein